MANYAIMRIEKRKLGAVGRICRHNERLKTEYKSNPDIDLERTKDNYHIIGPCRNYRKAVLDKIEEAGARMRKDSVVLQDCFIGATPEWIRSKPPEEQRQYFEHAVRFFEQKFGKQNIISAVAAACSSRVFAVADILLIGRDVNSESCSTSTAGFTATPSAKRPSTSSIVE